MTTKPAGYSLPARWLHWAVAGMIVTQFVLAELAERAEHSEQLVRQLALLANHKSVGMTILALAVVRVLYRLVWRPPPLPASMPGWQVTASKLSHAALYVLLFALPVTGWVMSSASAYSVSWFGLFQIPDLVAADPALKERMAAIHEALGYALYAVAGLHVAAALKHALVDRDGVLGRISSVGSLAAFVAIIVLGLTWLASPGNARNVPPAAAPAGIVDAGPPAQDSTAGEPPAAEAPAAPAPQVDDDPAPVRLALDPAASAPANARTSPPSEPAPEPEPAPPPLPVWNINYDASFIRFTGDQAGAKFVGRWTDWQAELRFAADRLDASRFDVTVNTAGVDTLDAERDAVLADAEWFDVANHPQAFYQASDFEPAGEGRFLARGQLTIKGRSTPVGLEFTVTANGEQRVIQATTRTRLLLGQALLDRLALGVGTGEWEDTEWVGQEVLVEVRVEATVP